MDPPPPVRIGISFLIEHIVYGQPNSADAIKNLATLEDDQADTLLSSLAAADTLTLFEQELAEAKHSDQTL